MSSEQPRAGEVWGQPACAKKLAEAGWKFFYDPDVQFVGASHPLGGKQSVAEVYQVNRTTFDRDEIGHAIAAMLNGPATPPAEPAATRRLPNAVMQSRPTNCFQACVATILGLPIDEVPEACDGAKWDWDAFQDWLALRGLQAIEVGFGNGGTIYPVRKPVTCIVTGESPRECTTGRHAVVGELLGLEGFRLLHDPHPSEVWIDGEPTHAVFFVPISPPVELASEWPDGAPEGATELRCDFDGCMYFKIPLNTCFGRGIKTVNYTGPAPASWAGKPWNECVIYRPRPEGRGS